MVHQKTVDFFGEWGVGNGDCLYGFLQRAAYVAIALFGHYYFRILAEMPGNPGPVGFRFFENLGAFVMIAQLGQGIGIVLQQFYCHPSGGIAA